MTYPDLLAGFSKTLIIIIIIVITPADCGHNCYVNHGTDHVDKGGATRHDLHPQTGSQLGYTEKIDREQLECFSLNRHLFGSTTQSIDTTREKGTDI